MSDLEDGEVLENLTAFVVQRLLGQEHAADLTGTTPLQQLGVLNSVGTARLVAHIRETFDVRLSPAQLTGAHFRDLESIAALVVSNRAAVGNANV